jgi:hypothetical protein
MIETLILFGAGIGGFMAARNFVRERLKYVEAVQSPIAPIVVGVGAALISWPLAALPFITTATSAIFGIGTGLGTRSAARALRAGR